MNASEKETERNPWRRTEARPKVEIKDAILGVLAVFVCAMAIGGAIPSDWSWLLLAALFAYVVATVRSTGSVLLLLSIAFTAFLLTLSMEVATFVLALTVGTGSLAWVFTVLGKHRYLGIVALIAAFCISLFCRATPADAALTVCFFPAAAISRISR